MEHDSLAFASAVELAKLFREKKVSPVEVVELLLRRIEELNPKLNAYLTITGDEARAPARKAEKAFQKGEELPPLFGIPVSIKDLFTTRGIRTTHGSLTDANCVPDEDALSVERLRKVGVIILGKTNTPEFGMSPTTENRLGDFCRNPWNTECVSGGSSGGSAAAVAAGMGPLSLGSDGGGSIRIPSSFCGVYGIKPTYGLVPSAIWGGMPYFSTFGPITRTVADAALMLNVIAGPDPRATYCLRETPPDYLKALESKDEVKKLQIAWSPDLNYAAMDPEVVSIAKAAARSFERFGCSVEEASPDLWNAYPTAWRPIAWCDEYLAHTDALENQADRLVGYVKDYLEYGKKVTGADYAKALHEMWALQKQMLNFFDKYDLLLTPTLATTAFLGKSVDLRKENPHLTVYPSIIGGKKVHSHWGFKALTATFNMTGQPAATVPCGFSSDGLPIGLQIVGRRREDTAVLQASAVFEEIQPWADKRPSLG
jgi:Asp-tRNA(Asn)/Glu-tRNA(Gln) amidotransferase A subunit family amidase